MDILSTSGLKMPKRVNDRFKSEEIENYIESFLNHKTDGATFGQINEYLKEIGVVFSNSDKDRSGLSNTLKRMQGGRIRKIPKDSEHVYPRYVSLKQALFDTAVDGYLLNVESEIMMNGIDQTNDLLDDVSKINSKIRLSKDQKFVMKNIHRLGLTMMYLLMSSYTKPIKHDKSIELNKQRRKIWLNNSMFFNNQKSSYSKRLDVSIPTHFHYDEKTQELDEDVMDADILEPVMLEKISKINDVLRKLYPKTFKNLDEMEKVLDTIKDEVKQDWLSRPQEKIPIRDF